MNGDTDASGDISQTYNYPGSPVPITIRVRKSSTGTRYKAYKTSGTISGDYNLTVVLSEDTIAA